MKTEAVLQGIRLQGERSKLPYLLTVIFFAVGCTGRATASTSATVPSGTAYAVQLDPGDFFSVVDNPYFPLIPGSRYVYQGQTADGLESTEVEVLAETRIVLGIAATVVRDRVFLDGELIEDTLDFYAQDQEGNVWYLGEEVKNYVGGVLQDTAGSWQAGVDGAQPGIILFGDPTAHLGETYRQEYSPGAAEDMAELLSVSESVKVPYGDFDQVVKTRDFTPLEPGIEEFKFYASGIGMIKTIDQTTGEELVLVEFSAP